MRREIIQRIEIPEGIKVEINGNNVIVDGKEGKNERKFDFSRLDFEKKGNEIIIGDKMATKNEKKRINTIAAHIKNMMQGVQGKFEYKLKVCFSHFPVTVEVKGKEAIIKNFLAKLGFIHFHFGAEGSEHGGGPGVISDLADYAVDAEAGLFMVGRQG